MNYLENLKTRKTEICPPSATDDGRYVTIGRIFAFKPIQLRPDPNNPDIPVNDPEELARLPGIVSPSAEDIKGVVMSSLQVLQDSVKVIVDGVELETHLEPKKTFEVVSGNKILSFFNAVRKGSFNHLFPGKTFRSDIVPSVTITFGFKTKDKETACRIVSTVVEGQPFAFYQDYAPEEDRTSFIKTETEFMFRYLDPKLDINEIVPWTKAMNDILNRQVEEDKNESA